MLVVDAIHSYYGESHILQGVSLEVQKGELVALLGRNGAGKTTTLKVLLGMVRPSGGDARHAALRRVLQRRAPGFLTADGLFSDIRRRSRAPFRQGRRSVPLTFRRQAGK